MRRIGDMISMRLPARQLQAAAALEVDGGDGATTPAAPPLQAQDPEEVSKVQQQLGELQRMVAGALSQQAGALRGMAAALRAPHQQQQEQSQQVLTAGLQQEAPQAAGSEAGAREAAGEGGGEEALLAVAGGEGRDSKAGGRWLQSRMAGVVSTPAVQAAMATGAAAFAGAALGGLVVVLVLERGR